MVRIDDIQLSALAAEQICAAIYSPITRCPEPRSSQETARTLSFLVISGALFIPDSPQPD